MGDTPVYESRFVFVTPELATAWLSCNTINRPLSASTVQRYAAAMTGGRWEVSNDAIAFDKGGNLVNGQHRLAAVVKAGLGQTFVVVHGLEPTAFAVLDAGKKRSASDALSIAGYTNTKNLAAAARIIFWYLKQGRLQASAASVGCDNDMVLAIVDGHPQLPRSVQKAYNKGNGLTAPAHLVSMHYVYSRKYPSQANAFVDRFGDGVGLENGSPILALRNRLIRMAALREKPRADALALLVMAWNAYIERRPLTKLQLPSDRAAFPQPLVSADEVKEMTGR